MNHSQLYPDARRKYLRAADVERAMVCYCNAPGFAVVAFQPDHSLPGAAFLACWARKDDQKEQPSR